MARANLIAFLAIAVESVMVLSLAWIWLGPRYNGLLLQILSHLVPENVILEGRGHRIWIAVPMAQAPAQAIQVSYNMAMSQGLIVAIAVLLAMPGIKLPARLSLVAGAALLMFGAHLVGLYWVAQRLASAPAEGGSSLPLAFTAYLGPVWLVVPSLLWVAVLLWQRTSPQERKR